MNFNKHLKYYKQYLLDNRYKNLYLYLDALNYGFEGPGIYTAVFEGDFSKNSIYYEYNHTCQLLNGEINGFLLEMIHLRKPKMISMPKESDFTPTIDGYDSYEGRVFKYCNSSIRPSFDLIQATTELEFSYISLLICSNERIGKHYDVNNLCNQLKNRTESFTGRTFYCKKNNRIIGTISTYAENNEMAILGGLLVDEKFRHCGIGTRLLNCISAKLSSENKEIFLYCYDANLFEYYIKNGWLPFSKCLKYERRHYD